MISRPLAKAGTIRRSEPGQIALRSGVKSSSNAALFMFTAYLPDRPEMVLPISATAGCGKDYRSLSDSVGLFSFGRGVGDLTVNARLLLFGLRGGLNRNELPDNCPELLHIKLDCGSGLCVLSGGFANNQASRRQKYNTCPKFTSNRVGHTAAVNRPIPYVSRIYSGRRGEGAGARPAAAAA